MSVLFSGVDDTPAPLDEEAYRAWLISRQQSPIVYHSGAVHLKRLRVLARKINSHVRAALTTIHQAIVAAKMRRIRRELSKQYDVGFIDPNIEVVDVDLAGDRRLMLRHSVVKGARLNEADTKRVLQHLADLWSYDVSLVEIDLTGNVLKEYVLNPRGMAAAA